MTRPSVHFGGPDRPPGLLRDRLEERVEAVPPGGWIDWVSYYFRDRSLAEALVRARRRGVDVRVTLEAQPRWPGANDRVCALLSGPEGLAAGFRAVAHRALPRPGGALRARLHTKLYLFSHPRPAALVGSFNPSGDREADPRVTREIGDQDRGHNALVEIADGPLVEALRGHARWLHAGRHAPLERFAPAANRVLRAPGLEVFFHPRLRTRRWQAIVPPPGAGSRLRLAVSHLKSRAALRLLARAARRGTQVEVIAHDTHRRVPERAADRLRRSGVTFRRYRHPDALPMHHKFVLAEGAGRRRLLFGSLNLTDNARWCNHEIAVLADDPELWRRFEQRWLDMHPDTS